MPHARSVYTATACHSLLKILVNYFVLRIHYTYAIFETTCTIFLLPAAASTTTTTSPLQSHLGRARHYPYIGECTLPLHVLAVACTMHNEALWGIMERYGSDVHHYRTLQSAAGHYGTLQKRYGCCGALQNITEHFVMLWNVTETLQKTSILPITNWILKFAHHKNVGKRALHYIVLSDSNSLTGDINLQSSH